MATYGNTVLAGSLANTTLVAGRLYDNPIAFDHSGTLVSVKKYLIGGSGYAAGTGGTVQYQLQSDDGSPNHLPSGVVLGSTAATSANAAVNSFSMAPINFTAGIPVQAGQIYHLVARNTDLNGNQNYISEDDLTAANGPNTAPPPGTHPLGVLFKDGSGPWTLRSDYTATVDFGFADGTHTGDGYMEVSSTGAGGGKGHTAFGAQKVGEVFTPTTTMTTASLRVAAVHMSGSSPLTATLTSNGQVVASAVESEVLPVKNTGFESYNQQMASFNLATTLQAGTTYRLEISAPSDSVYAIHGVRDGLAAGYGWDKATVFNDGYAVFNAGSSWTTGWDTWGDPPVDKDQDLTFSFSTDSSGGGGGITPHALSLILSGDAARRVDPQFLVKLDGTQIGGPSSVTADHDRQQTQTFDYSGLWSPGTHAVEIDFINDIPGGRASAGRNLYVEGVKYDGASYLDQEHALLRNGGFAVTVGIHNESES